MKEVRVNKMEHKSEEYLKINPAGTVPCLREIGDDGSQFYLFESHAMMRYLAQTRQCPDHWFPTDPKKRALVNQYLDWHHTFLRQGSGGYVFRLKFASIMAKDTTGSPFSKETLDYYKGYLKRSLVIMERWLSKSEYLCGGEPSIADISAVCELEQVKFIPYDYSEEFKKVKAWRDRLFTEFKELGEVHEMHEKFVAKSLGRHKL